MSPSDQVFFDPGHAEARVVAPLLAGAVDGWSVVTDDDVTVVVRLDDLREGLVLAGDIDRNDPIPPVDPADPTDREIFDSYPLMWTMRAAPIDDVDDLHDAARQVFDRLVTSGLGWPLVLSFEFSELIATYDVERGVRTFPPGTSSNGTDARLWC